MINATGAAPLFWYIYRPTCKNSRDTDGGFNIALYPDHRLVYSRYNQANQIVDQSAFQLPPEVTAHRWMGPPSGWNTVTLMLTRFPPAQL